MRSRVLQVLRWVPLLLIAVAVVWGPHLAWRLRARRTLSAVIVDKTVPFHAYREHAFLPWLLHAAKVTRPDGRFLDDAHDYVGYDPAAKIGHDLEPAHLEGADVLFIADTYGVYAGDYEIPGDVAALERSARIYGGVTDREAAAIEAFSARGGLLMAEFNTFASPTKDSARAALERTFGVRWTKWVGRYWVDLRDSSAVPRWIGQVYEHVYGRQLAIDGGAFVFVREDQDIVVLEAGRHLEADVLTLERTREGADLEGLPPSSSYWYWVDVLERVEGDVLYDHTLHLTPEGSALVASHHIPERFPALVRRKGRSTFYFAGDFVDSSVQLGNPERAGLLWWRRHTVDATPEDRFAWRWYAPIVDGLLSSRAHRL